MNEYTPDKWVLLKVTNNGEILYKILSGWSGSYLYGASWKINSGITRVEETDEFYFVYGYSGSVYKCRKVSYGVTSLTASVYDSFEKQCETITGAEIELLSYEDCVIIFKDFK